MGGILRKEPKFRKSARTKVQDEVQLCLRVLTFMTKLQTVLAAVPIPESVDRSGNPKHQTRLSVYTHVSAKI